MRDHDAEVVIAAACLFHDTGMSIHRTDHEAYSLFLAAERLPGSARRRLRRARAHGGGGRGAARDHRPPPPRRPDHGRGRHRARGRRARPGPGPLAGARSRTAGRTSTRCPRPRSTGWRSRPGDEKAVTIEIAMNNSAGIFQVDELLATKLRGSGLEEHVEVVAQHRGRAREAACAGVQDLGQCSDLARARDRAAAPAGVARRRTSTRTRASARTRRSCGYMLPAAGALAMPRPRSTCSGCASTGSSTGSGTGRWRRRRPGDSSGAPGVKQHPDWPLDPENTEVGWLYDARRVGPGLRHRGAPRGGAVLLRGAGAARGDLDRPPRQRGVAAGDGEGGPELRRREALGGARYRRGLVLAPGSAAL